MNRHVIRNNRHSEPVYVEHHDAGSEYEEVVISYGHDGINGSIHLSRADARNLFDVLGQELGLDPR